MMKKNHKKQTQKCKCRVGVCSKHNNDPKLQKDNRRILATILAIFFTVAFIVLAVILWCIPSFVDDPLVCTSIIAGMGLILTQIKICVGHAINGDKSKVIDTDGIL